MKGHLKMRLVWSALFVTALSFIGIGIWRGEQNEVLGKAVKVCLECIGIG